jgi:hypothetical protein
MRPWVIAIAGVILLAGCGAAAAASGSGAAHHSSGAGSARACKARPGQAIITLTDTSPAPAVNVRVGADVVVTVPRWGWGTATDVNLATGGILRQKCTVTLPHAGRRTIFVAARAGRTRLGATVQPASNLMMPAWGGEVIVSAA